MEFAVEMVLKATLYDARVSEVPITLHPDKRRSRGPHLKTFRDGWRTLRFYALSTPRWLFLYPGLFLILIGFVGYALAYSGIKIFEVRFDVHTLLVASLAIVAGFQAVAFSVSAKIFAITERILPEDPAFSNLFRYFTLERGLTVGALSVAAGFALIGYVFMTWSEADFGEIDAHIGLRFAIPGAVLMILGIQAVLRASSLVSSE